MTKAVLFCMYTLFETLQRRLGSAYFSKYEMDNEESSNKQFTFALFITAKLLWFGPECM